jgi:FeS assembly SUF system protein
MDRDPFDFGPEGPAAEAEVERPEGGEDDLALMAPVLAALKTVRDPEIPMDLVELGLIYELIVKQGGTVYVEMTLTTPACPVAASMPGEVEAAIRAVPGVNDVRVKLVWTPPWGPERMSEEARLELGMMWRPPDPLAGGPTPQRALRRAGILSRRRLRLPVAPAW